MTMNNGMRVKRRANAVWRTIDGDVVVLLPEGDVLHALSGCGSRVWELVEAETAVSEIVQTICGEYEVEPQKAREEITEFVHKLASLKLVEIVPAVREGASR